MDLDSGVAVSGIGGCGCAVEDEYGKIRKERVKAVVEVDFVGCNGQQAALDVNHGDQCLINLLACSCFMYHVPDDAVKVLEWLSSGAILMGGFNGN